MTLLQELLIEAIASPVKIHFMYRVYDSYGTTGKVSKKTANAVKVLQNIVIDNKDMYYEGPLKFLELLDYEPGFKRIVVQMKKGTGVGVSIHGESADLGFGFDAVTAKKHFDVAQKKTAKEMME